MKTTGNQIEKFMNKHCTVYHPSNFPDSAMEVTLFHNEQKVSVHCVSVDNLTQVCVDWTLKGKKPNQYTVYNYEKRLRICECCGNPVDNCKCESGDHVE